MLDVVGCQTGSARYPSVEEAVNAGGHRWSVVECFDKCERCEVALLVKIEGTLMRFGGTAELTEALTTLGSR